MRRPFRPRKQPRIPTCRCAGACCWSRIEGLTVEVNALIEQAAGTCRLCDASEVRVSLTEAERASMEGAQSNVRAIRRLAPNYIVQDGVIRRTALSQILNEIQRLSRETGLVANVFHAGDGNLHPLVWYDGRIAGQE